MDVGAPQQYELRDLFDALRWMARAGLRPCAVLLSAGGTSSMSTTKARVSGAR
jgi:hypothetical protein